MSEGGEVAGKPITRLSFQLIEKHGGEAWVLEQIAQGHGYRRMSKDIGVSLPVFSNWAVATPQRQERFRRAREQAAMHLAEDVLTIADEATYEDERVARLRIDTRKWLASKWAPSVYGDNKGPVVQVNITDMHLRAVRNAEVIEVDAGGIVKPDNER
jgi:hypothetical protein